MESLRGRDSLEGRVRQCTRRWFRSLGLTWWSSTTNRREVESNFNAGKGTPTVNSVSTAFKRVSLKWLTPSIFQDPLQVKVNEETKRRVLEWSHRNPAEELDGILKIMSGYERVFRSLRTDGMFVKLSKTPGGGVGPS